MRRAPPPPLHAPPHNLVLGEVGDADAPERRRATQVVGCDRRERKIGQPLLMEGAQSAGFRCEAVFIFVQRRPLLV